MGKANEKDRCDGQEWVVRKDHADVGAGPGHFIGGSPGYMEGRTLGVRHQVQRPTRKGESSARTSHLRIFSYNVHPCWSMGSQILRLQGTLSRSTYPMAVGAGL